MKGLLLRRARPCVLAGFTLVACLSAAPAHASFQPSTIWTEQAYYGDRGTPFADVTGEGRADAIAVNNGNVAVRPSSGSFFPAPAQDWTGGAYYGDRGTPFADVNFDGKADAIAVNNGNVAVRLSNGSSFPGPAQDWTGGAYYGDRGTGFADVNGDGKADAIAVNNGNVAVRLSNGGSFPGPAQDWTGGAYYGDRGTYFADVTGDGKADAIALNNGSVAVRPSNGGSFPGPAQQWTEIGFYGQRDTAFVDVTGDGKADAIAVNDDKIAVRPSSGSSFPGPAQQWTTGPYYGDRGTFFADVTGGGEADAIAVNNGYIAVAAAKYPPDTSITSGPSGDILPGSASFGFSSSESLSTFECRLEGPGQSGAYSSCTSQKTYSSLTAGQYKFSVRATDRSGNVDPSAAEREFTVVACDQVATPGTTLDTLGELYAALQEGQVGCLHSGTTYTTVGLTGDDTLYITKRGITIQSYPGERAKVNGRIVVRGTPFNGKPVSVRKIDFDGTAAPTGAVAFVFDQLDPNVPLNAQLTDSDVKNLEGICIGSDNTHLTYGIRIERNRIHDCLPSNNHNHGIYLTKARNALIQHNVIFDNGDRGIQLYPDTDGTTIVGNVIDGNRNNLHYAGDGPATSSDNNVAYNNILSNPRTCCTHPDDPQPWNFYTLWSNGAPTGSGNVLRDSCSYSTVSGSSGTPAGSGIDQSQGGVSVSGITVADPGYANRGAKDFRVSSGPCAAYAPPASVAQP